MIPCTLRQLEVFLAAAEDCHFARTANRLGISQPAVTNHIASLESQLGKQLFIRRRGTTPTLSSDGMAFLGQARTFIAASEQITAFRSERGIREAPLVRVAAGMHILEDYIRPRLSEFYCDNPNFVIECCQVQTAAQGAHLLEKGAIDIMLFTVEDPHSWGLHVEVMRPIRLAVYGAPAFASHRSAPAGEISRLPFILPPEGSEQQRMVQSALRNAGVLCSNIVVRAQFSDVITKLAVGGTGVAALFDTMVTDHVARGELVEFDLAMPPRHRTLFRRDAVSSRAVAVVQEFLGDILRD
jgi:LysR family hydrogen peroxide-inducible transcriptional activator